MHKHTSHFRECLCTCREDCAQTTVYVEGEVKLVHVCGFEVRLLRVREEGAEATVISLCFYIKVFVS